MARFLNLVILLVWLAALALASVSGATAGASVAVDGKRKTKRNLALLIGQPIPIQRAERRILNFGPRREFMYVNPNYQPVQVASTSRRKLHSGPGFPIRFEPMIQYSQTDPLYENDFGASKYIKNDLSTGDSTYEQYAHGQGHASSLDQSYGMHDSEPIIEIIIKESNETLPPSPHQSPIWTPMETTTPKNNINVFYVPYQKNPNGKGKNSIIYGKPVAALTPIEYHQTESDDGKVIEHDEQQKPTEAPLDWYKNRPTTTLRAIIKPDTEQHLLASKKLKITFSDSKLDLDGSQNVWPSSNDRSVLDESSPPFVYAQKPPFNFNRSPAIKKSAIPQPPFFDGPRLQLQLPQFFPRIPISYLTPPPLGPQFHSHPQLPLQHHQSPPPPLPPQTHTQPQSQPHYHQSVDELQQRPHLQSAFPHHFAANNRKPASFGPQRLPSEQTVNFHSSNHQNVDNQKKVVNNVTPNPSQNVDHTKNLAPLIANGDFGEIYQSHPKYEQHLVSDNLYSSFIQNSPVDGNNYYNKYYSTTNSPHFFAPNLDKTRSESTKVALRAQQPHQLPSSPAPTTTTTTTSTTPSPANKSHFQLPQIGEEKLKKNSAKLPDEVPEDLREQLLASGVLDNADITVLDYDKVGSIPIEKLPADQLAHFLSAGGGQQIAAAGSEPVAERVQPASSSPNRKSDRDHERDPVQMKIVRYDAKKENDYANKYIEPGAQKIRPVQLNDRGYNRYLPLHINGTHFPIPDELADRNISSVVVLAPIDYQFRTMKKRNLDRASHENGIEVDAFLGRLVMSPSRENFRKWLDFEKNATVNQQSIVFLVVAKDSQNNEIYKYDVTNDHVKLTDDKLSEKYVQAALANKIKKNKV